MVTARSRPWHGRGAEVEAGAPGRADEGEADGRVGQGRGEARQGARVGLAVGVRQALQVVGLVPDPRRGALGEQGDETVIAVRADEPRQAPGVTGPASLASRCRAQSTSTASVIPSSADAPSSVTGARPLTPGPAGRAAR